MGLLGVTRVRGAGEKAMSKDCRRVCDLSSFPKALENMPIPSIQGLSAHDFGWHECFCQEVVGIRDDGSKIMCGKVANASVGDRYLCRAHL